MNSTPEALERLVQGNVRFVSGARGGKARGGRAGLAGSAKGQDPFAVVLGCSDSRVPAEIIFDQGPGDLFVIRVAGNIVAPSQLGSVELAVESFGVGLVVVLGHSACGAVLATLEELQNPTASRSPNLGCIIDRIRPSLESWLDPEFPWDADDRVQQAVRANIRASVHQLRHGSELLEGLVRNDELVVVGAEYSLDTGIVDFFEEDPSPSQY